MDKRFVAVHTQTLLMAAPLLGIIFRWFHYFIPTAFCFIVPADGPPFSESLLPLVGLLSVAFGFVAMLVYCVFQDPIDSSLESVWLAPYSVQCFGAHRMVGVFQFTINYSLPNTGHWLLPGVLQFNSTSYLLDCLFVLVHSCIEEKRLGNTTIDSFGREQSTKASKTVAPCNCSCHRGCCYLRGRGLRYNITDS